MHFFTLPVLAALTSLTSVYASVTLSVKRGCITYQDPYGVQRGLCAGHTALANDVSAHIKACVDVKTGTSGCALDIDDVHLTSQIYWGVNDCLYNNAPPGPPDELIICARPVSPPVKLPFNPYATSSKRRGLGAAGEE